MTVTTSRKKAACHRNVWAWLRWGIACVPFIPGIVLGAEKPDSAPSDRQISRDILSEREWQDVDNAVDRGLAWLIRQQREGGAFQTLMTDEPGVTGLCLLAFLSRGQLPDEGPYGKELSRAAEFILGSQQQDGMMASERHAFHGAYSHGIGSLVITELYGMPKPRDDARFRAVIERALQFTSRRHSQPKSVPDDEGGWRYLRRHGNCDSDLSVTSWNLMFLRSARNSGFDVDVRLIDEALAYLERTYDPAPKTFRYAIGTQDLLVNRSRAMAGVGVVSLSLAGKHDTEIARNAANYILERPFDQYVRPIHGEGFPCYSAFFCSQAMYQMGGDYWSRFYPVLARTLVKAQREDGSWIMKAGKDVEYGVPYMTAITILALTPHYQMLPIFQR